MAVFPIIGARQRGSALVLTVHVVLLLLVLGQIVYLASRYRTRVDLTSDRLWTSTESTRTLLDKLDKRLVVEAYFSPKERLPVNVRETRAWADSFLDELVQVGAGKVVVQRFDPNADKAVADKATRVGVKPLDLSSRSSTSLSTERHWQGLRLVYGGGKQHVIQQWLPGSSFLAEAVLTPAIKQVMTEQKRRIGYMEWPATNPQGAQQGGIGWNVLRTLEQIAKRYEFQNFKDEDGALLPADLDTLFLFRPKDLTDRQKYVLDQFVVKGGTLVAFVDAAEYVIGPNRNFARMPLSIDAAGSQQKFTDQLLHYGVDWRPKVLADMWPRAHTAASPLQEPYEYFAVPQQTQFGQTMTAVLYPYFFHAVADDWSKYADDLAKDEQGKVDRELADTYRKLFVHGMPSDEFVFKAFKQITRGPGFYWPTWVGLRQKAGGAPDLPPDVEGRVLLWSSPAVLAEDPPQMIHPLGMGAPTTWRAELDKFNQKLNERYRAEPRQQAPLMVDVKGRFTSFFAGQDRPRRPSEIKEEEAKKSAPPKVDDPNTPDVDESKANANEGPQPALQKDTDAATLAAEPAMATAGEKPGRVLLIGDSDFIRDDVVRGDHARAGGPVSSRTGAPFFAQLLDWLAEDSDLVALQSKAAVDRTLKFVDASTTPNADPRLAEQVLRRKTTWLRAVNVVVPGALLGLLGLGVFLLRRQQKKSFLSSLT